jgi:hypothetical protein
MGPSVTFVCCVESGSLEALTVRLVESLRRFGGRFAQAPFYAVTPRFGPPLARETHACFARNQVHYVRRNFPSRYGWFKFLNKPLAVNFVEQQAQTDVICWLDSDLLFLSEPDALDMTDVDFVATASDKEMGSSGPGDPYEPLWVELCRAVGLQVDDLPWFETTVDQQRIRAYWNGGFFAYRRSYRMGREYLTTCERLLDARLRTDAGKFSTGINEMSALGLAMVKLKMRYRALPFPYNFPLGVRTPPAWYSLDRLKQVKILHYHDSMWPPFWPTLLARLKESHPPVAAWLEAQGPMANTAALPARVLTRGLNHLRNRRETAYKSECRVL